MERSPANANGMDRGMMVRLHQACGGMAEGGLLMMLDNEGNMLGKGVGMLLGRGLKAIH